MAGKPRDYETTYKGRKVRTDCKQSMEYLYVEERLSTTDIEDVFGGRMSYKTVARRLKKLGIPRRNSRGKNNPMWAGGIKIGKGGYILVWRPDHPHANTQGYVPEHRLVMEDHIGRYLDPNEIVHHINSDRQDNSIENLQLLESNSAHAKLHSETRPRCALGRFI